MDRSVPGVRSPACTGITVWQLPHGQIWCDPRWRMETQPRSRSLRISTRAVTSRVYRPRRMPVQVNGHVGERAVVVTHAMTPGELACFDTNQRMIG